MKIGLIVNPVAGGGIALKNLDKIRSSVDSLNEIVITRKPREASEIARKFSALDFDYVIAAGGDGTLNEVSQGLIGTETVMIPLALGNGSDFTRTTGRIHHSTLKDSLRENRVRTIDTVRVDHNSGQKHFINVMEIGFGASVMKRFGEKRKPSRNTSFTRQILMETMSLKSYEVDMVIGMEKYSGKVIEVILANGRYFGRGLLASPGSLVDDGRMEIHIIEGMSRLKFLMKLGKLKNGSYTDEKEVKNFGAMSFEMFTENVPLEIDGEFIGFSPLKVDLEPKSLKILTPPEYTGAE
ncbi:MAG: diacylglycerol kinase family protein [Thermoplasmataceae archaeon]